MKDKLHIIAVFSLVLVLALIAFIADNLLKPESFDKHGHYRWNAISEISSKTIVNQNKDTCKACHNDIYQLHQKDAHYNVQCVNCHGAGNLHVAYYRHDKNSKNITLQQATLEKQYKLEGCLFCHRKLMARPSDFPQVDKSEHYKFLHVIDPNTNCTGCHSPHEPIFLLTESRQARLHPIVYKCTDCHSKPVNKDYSDVADHPKIFECKDCHAALVADFNTRPHHMYIDCRTCHLFKKESETIGRIYKNGNAKFCLLCHERKSFKSDSFPPKIDWPSHVETHQSNLVRFVNQEFLEKTDAKICLNCHEKQIHIMNRDQKSSPHPFNWRMDHGKFALAKSGNSVNSSCSYCHQKDFCSSCHKVDVPHSDDFKEGGHKSFVQQKGRQICANCHKQEFCKQCHD